MNKKKIFIDAGHNHSGFNTGAVNNALGLREQDISFDVVFLLGQKLEPYFDIMLSRPTNETNLGHDNASAINQRWQMANAWGADYFVSVHVNAGGGHGGETFFFAGGNERARLSREFSQALNDVYCEVMALRNRGVKPDTKTNIGSIGVLRNTEMPAALIELAFIDAPPQHRDLRILQSETDEMAGAMAKGIYTYFGMNPEKPYEISHVHDATIPAHTNEITSCLPAQAKDECSVMFDLFGELVEVNGNIKDGVTRVRARQLLEAIGFDVNWNGDKGIIEVRHGELSTKRLLDHYVHNEEEELHILQQIVHDEARGEDLEGQIMVANVILNRMNDSNRFPNTIRDVIMDSRKNADGSVTVQFTPTQRPEFGTATPNERTVQAVEKALSGTDLSQGALYFHAISHLHDDVWHERAVREGKLAHLFDHGNHRFYK